MKYKSIRWRLPVTYAGIALITALALGGVLLLILRDYYSRREQSYLQRNAEAISAALAPLLGQGQAPPGLPAYVDLLSLLSQTRVKLLDKNQSLIADSGMPGETRPLVVSALPARQAERIAGGPNQDYLRPAPGAGEPQFFGLRLDIPVGELPAQIPLHVSPDTLQFFYSRPAAGAPPESGEEISGPAGDELAAVIPMVGTMYGFDLQGEPEVDGRRSAQVFAQQITLVSGEILGTIEVSGGPAYGWEIVRSVARVWLFASLVAVVIAGATGWWVSRRITSPLLALTHVTQEMAAGDLSARADVAQQDEIGLLASSFNEMADRISRTMEILRRFAADAAHELHTPITALRTSLEVVAGDLSTTVQPAQESDHRLVNQELIIQALDQVKKLGMLTDDLLDLSRIETASGKNDVGLLDVCALVRETCEPYASQAEAAEIEFLMDLPGNQVMIPGHSGQLQRALGNLLDNALKFSRPGGRITVGVLPEERNVSLWVEDTGIGIPDEDIPFLFNRFHRGQNAADFPGSGLGLAIVKAIVDLHGGKVYVERASGFTRFVLLLLV